MQHNSRGQTLGNVSKKCKNKTPHSRPDTGLNDAVQLLSVLLFSFSSASWPAFSFCSHRLVTEGDFKASLVQMVTWTFDTELLLWHLGREDERDVAQSSIYHYVEVSNHRAEGAEVQAGFHLAPGCKTGGSLACMATGCCCFLLFCVCMCVCVRSTALMAVLIRL